MAVLSGQTALVTGATRGLGKAISQKLLSNGAQVVGVYSGNETAAQLFLDELGPQAENVLLHKCDVSDADQVATLFDIVETRYNTIEILVNNAGIRRDGLVALMKKEQWAEVIDVNLTGSFLVAQKAILLMMKNKYGRIINITSPVARLGFAGQANYAASKAGQIAMTKSLAKEVARKKITVNCVSPGFISTDFIEDLDTDTIAAYKKMVPVRKFGTPEDVAHGVMFLAHPDSSYITGTVLEISGGL